MFRFWLTPLKLSLKVQNILVEAGLQPWPESASSLPGNECILLYERPDQLIAAAVEQSELFKVDPVKTELITAHEIVNGYCNLLQLSQQTRQPLLSASRLQSLDPAELQSWLRDPEGTGSILSDGSHLESKLASPLLAATTLRLLDLRPALLDRYKDLELRAELLGRDPDLHYRQYLLQACSDGDGLIAAICQHLSLPLQIGTLRRELDQQEARANRLDMELQQVRQQNQRLQAEAISSVEQLKAKDQQYHDQSAACQQLRQGAEELQDRHQQELEVLRWQLQQLQTNLTDDLHKSRHDCEQLKTELLQAQIDLERVFLDGRSNEQLLQIRSAELEQSHNQLLASQAARQHVEASLHQQLEVQRLELEQILQNHEQQNAQAQQTLQALQGELLNLQNTYQRDIEDVRGSLEAQCTGLARQLSEAQQASEQLKLELHLAQEDLEHYFLQARASQQLVAGQQQELLRAQAILVRLHPSTASPQSMPTAKAVEVLPAMEANHLIPTLQEEALLKAYADNLKRASSLLQRLGRS